MEKRDPETYAIIGAAMEVHRVLGNGFLERVYHEALAIEFTKRGIAFNREQTFEITYKQQPLAVKYRADFVCFDQVIVEVKAIAQLTSVEHSQGHQLPESRAHWTRFASQLRSYEPGTSPADPIKQLIPVVNLELCLVCG